MATADSLSQNALSTSSASPPNGATTNLSISLEKISLQEQEQTGTSPETEDPPRRRLHVYARPQILLLAKSSLVKRPDGMPALKDWFGDWNEQQVSSKKDSESSSTTTSTRDRRFRRDVDDGELPPRPAFRATLSQPSQMGNFRHQSIRTTERDKDKDTDKERERDIRDKEGAEKLRSLSDKYDRDRLALSATSSLRNKDRDSAPHLGASSSARLTQGHGVNGARRVEGRDSAKRKPGESEDWRRGSEPSRNARDDRSDNGRRERDNRERPRSRSRLRRDPSTTRRDRDRDRDDRARDRRGDDRDEHRRDREEFPRRDRDDYHRRDWDDRLRDKDEVFRERRDTEGEEDPRRWRDDGKRDERMAARRGWDRWEPGSDRTDDRDGRSKRANGRDRRSGPEEGKEKEERREREKEKEPAWMEYDVSSPGGGIIGQSAEGELDSIQAFKKDMREKERKEKEGDDAPDSSAKLSPVEASGSLSAGPEVKMDEIQQFKLMMKAAAEQKGGETPQNGADSSSSARQVSNGAPLNPVAESQDTLSGDRGADLRGEVTVPNSSTQNNSLAITSNGAQSLLSLISSSSPSPNTPQSLTEKQPIDNVDAPQPVASRFFPNPPGLPTNHSRNLDRSPVEPPSSSPASSFNPPQGSRLLAFASRAPGAAIGPSLKSSGSADSLMNNVSSVLSTGPGTSISNPKLAGNDPSSGMALEYQYAGGARITPSEASFASRSYSPFGQQSQSSFVFEEIPESRLGPNHESLRRASGLPPSNQFGSSSEAGSPYQEMVPNGPPFDLGGNPAGANYAAGKGSRFAKFFDTKREAQPGPGVRRTSATGFVSTSPHPAHRQDPMTPNGMGGGNAENRTMEDIFAMLQNSAQHHRASPQIGQPHRVPGGGAPFGPNHDLQVLQLQQLQQQQQYAHNRLDSLYDSRLDDRNFVPDGMVPGLRPAPRPRSREPSGVLYNEHLDDLQYNVQRIPQPQRNLEQMYPGPMYNQHPNQPNLGRNTGVQLQQAQFRGGPSPIQTSIPNLNNRLPPGLANLGARPPHDPTQFMNSPIGVSGGLHGGISPNAPAQQGFNSFGGAGNIGFGGNPQGRGPLPGPHHQNPLTLNQLGGLGHNASLDLRGPSLTQAQLLGLSGNMRGANFNPQHGPVGPMQGPHLAALRPQQQHLPPHLVQQMLPPHLQPQQSIPGGNAQGAQDLMALLMGNHRD